MAVQVGKKKQQQKKETALNTNILKLFGHNACLISYEKALQGWKKCFELWKLSGNGLSLHSSAWTGR